MRENIKEKNFEVRVFDEIANSKMLYEPLTVSVREGHDKSTDTRLKIEWLRRSTIFNAEIVSRASPQILNNKIRNLKARFKKERLMVVVPYLSTSVVEILKDNKLSGLDLNGNYYIMTPEFLAIRLDKKNEFKESATIRKIYSGTSSVVCRYLLTSDKIPTGIGEIAEKIKSRGCEITISTVSKVLKRLEEELIVSRSSKSIKVLQKDKLLENLVREYVQPKISQQRRIKVPEGASAFLKKEMWGGDIKWSMSGDSSAARYTMAAFPEACEIYIEKIPKSWLKWEDDRFFNIILNETKSSFVHFDSAPDDSLRFSSKLQSYLELANGDKRQREIGESLRKDLLG